MLDKNFMAFDLECNQPSKSIIQVGIVVGNLKSGEILDKEQWNINVDEEISDYITNLTGITQTDVDNGEFIGTVYDNICHIRDYYQCFRNPIVWGGQDCSHFRQEMNIKDEEPFVFGFREIDAKTLYVSWRFKTGTTYQAGLGKALVKMGLEFQGKKHTAMDDAYNTFIIYRKLLEKFGE